jgi:hypothetical protein
MKFTPAYEKTGRALRPDKRITRSVFCWRPSSSISPNASSSVLDRSAYRPGRIHTNNSRSMVICYDQFIGLIHEASDVVVIDDNARRPQFSHTAQVDPVQLVHFGSAWMKFTSCPAKEQKRMQQHSTSTTALNRWGTANDVSTVVARKRGDFSLVRGKHSMGGPKVNQPSSSRVDGEFRRTSSNPNIPRGMTFSAPLRNPSLQLRNPSLQLHQPKRRGSGGGGGASNENWEDSLELDPSPLLPNRFHPSFMPSGIHAPAAPSNSHERKFAHTDSFLLSPKLPHRRSLAPPTFGINISSSSSSGGGSNATWETLSAPSQWAISHSSALAMLNSTSRGSPTVSSLQNAQSTHASNASLNSWSNNTQAIGSSSAPKLPSRGWTNDSDAAMYKGSSPLRDGNASWGSTSLPSQRDISHSSALAMLNSTSRGSPAVSSLQNAQSVGRRTTHASHASLTSWSSNTRAIGSSSAPKLPSRGWANDSDAMCKPSSPLLDGSASWGSTSLTQMASLSLVMGPKGGSAAPRLPSRRFSVELEPVSISMDTSRSSGGSALWHIPTSHA